MRRELQACHGEMSKMQKVAQERQTLHVADMQSLQSALAILKQMESERESLAGADKDLVLSMLAKLQHHCEGLQVLATTERGALRTEIETLRRHLAERERTFNQHLQALQALVRPAPWFACCVRCPVFTRCCFLPHCVTDSTRRVPPPGKTRPLKP